MSTVKSYKKNLQILRKKIPIHLVFYNRYTVENLGKCGNFSFWDKHIHTGCFLRVKNHDISNYAYADWREYKRVEGDYEKPSCEKNIFIFHKKRIPKGNVYILLTVKTATSKVFGDISINNLLTEIIKSGRIQFMTRITNCTNFTFKSLCERYTTNHINCITKITC